MQLFGKFARRFYVLVLIPPSPSLPFRYSEFHAIGVFNALKHRSFER